MGVGFRRLEFRVSHAARIGHPRVRKTLPVSVGLTAQIDFSLQVTPGIVTCHVL